MGDLPVPLNQTGRRQARVVARLLKEVALDACYASPAMRALETAQLIVRGRSLSVAKVPEILEINYGAWVGKYFDEVTSQPAYRLYHATPKRSCPPGGESMKAVHRRTVAFMERLRVRHRNGRILVVSHADIIKTIIVHYLGLNLDHLQKFRIDNASVSLLWFHKKTCRVLSVNHLGVMPHLFGPSMKP